ncbi:MAG: S8 family serine peptidase [Oscillospiraceae bacterium]
MKNKIIAFFLAVTILFCLPFSGAFAAETDTDEDGGEKIFLADTYDEALKTANYYNAELESYRYGVGVLTDVKGPSLIGSIFTYSADLPELSDNDMLYALDYETQSYDDYSTVLQWHHGAIETEAAWAYSMGSSDVTVAVIDSGVVQSHEDLDGQIIEYKDFCSFSDTPYDNAGHGTHVAGIIAAIAGNGLGGTGVAPGARILSLKALDEYFDNTAGKYVCGGNTSDVLAAFNYAVGAGIKVINMSIGGDSYNETFQAAVANAVDSGVTVICAAGNDGEVSECYPAAYTGAIAVAAVENSSGTYGIASYSNYGIWVDLAAPGSEIFSTYNEPTSSYAWADGTSMACPVVAGVAALIYSCRAIDADASGAAIVLSILNSTLTGSVSRSGYTYGIVNAKKAAMVASASDAPVYSEGSKAVFSSLTQEITVSSPVLAALGGNLSGSSLYISVTTPDGTVGEYTAYSSASQTVTLETAGNYTVKAYADVLGENTPVSQASYVMLDESTSLAISDSDGNAAGVLYPSFSGDAGVVDLSASGVLYDADPDDLSWETTLPGDLVTLTENEDGTATLTAGTWSAEDVTSGTVTVTDNFTLRSATYSVQLLYEDIAFSLSLESDSVSAYLGFSDSVTAEGGVLYLAFYRDNRMTDIEAALVQDNMDTYMFDLYSGGWTYARAFLITPGGLPLTSRILYSPGT